MLSNRTRSDPPSPLRRRIERLEGLPLRPATARHLASGLTGDGPEDREAPLPARLAESDPGWALALEAGTPAPLEVLAVREWWPAPTAPGAEALDQLWRHAVAASCAARRLAREAGRPDADRLARLGLLHGLGLWVVAAVDVGLLALLLTIRPASRRREEARGVLGSDPATLGRLLAERWGLGKDLVDAAWLHADLGAGLEGCADDPEGLVLIQKAFAWAERTPWALDPPPAPDPGPPDPRLRLLVAEVQVRCGIAFAADASPREESLVRALARRCLQHDRLAVAAEARDRIIAALVGSSPDEPLSVWAGRAARARCGEPGVSAARVEWGDDPEDETWGRRSIRLDGGSVRVRSSGDDPSPSVQGDDLDAAWQAWADGLAARDRLAGRLEAVTEAHRSRVEREAHDRAHERLEGLAEFAAGAAHELNNPLAVVVGRAQLLLAKAADAETARSLRAIISQAQRAHRMLRDLIYAARPPAPRPRPCRVGEVLRACVRDLEPEAQARGVRLLLEGDDAGLVALADPDALRHLADVFTRNAIETTPPGGCVRVGTANAPDRLEWTFRDEGPGLDPLAARHLFDPFYCGRQAGRGLGLGLPRAARFVRLVGGSVRWRSAPARGTVFQLTLPLESNAGGDPPPAVVVTP